MQHFEFGLDQPHAEAAFHRGPMHSNSLGVLKSRLEAFCHSQLRARLMNVQFEYELGVYFTDGLGPVKTQIVREQCHTRKELRRRELELVLIMECQYLVRLYTPRQMNKPEHAFRALAAARIRISAEASCVESSRSCASNGGCRFE